MYLIQEDPRLTALKLAKDPGKVTLNSLSYKAIHAFLYRALGSLVPGFEPANDPEFGTLLADGTFYGPFVGQREGVAQLSYMELAVPIKSLLLTEPYKTVVKTKTQEVPVFLSGSLVVDNDTGSVIFKLEFEVTDKYSGSWDIFVSLPKLAEGAKRTLPTSMAMKRSIHEDRVDWMAWPSGGATPLVDLSPGEYQLLELGERSPNPKYANSYTQSGTLLNPEGKEVKVYLPALIQSLFVSAYKLPEGGVKLIIGAPKVMKNDRKKANFTLDTMALIPLEESGEDWDF